MIKRRAPNAERERQRAIDEAASDWLVRLSESPHAGAEQDAFEAWLAQDPAHGEAYDALSRTWEDAGQLKHLKALADPNPKLSLPAQLARGVAALWSRPGLAAGGFLTAAAAAAFAFVFMPPMLERPDAAFATPIAETRDVRLPDGSVVTLGAHSEIETFYSATERRVRLTSGEAFFDVVHNESLPFVVEAGGTIIRDIGTKFNVRRSDQRIGVSVAEGVVQVSQRGETARAGDRILRAGEQLDVAQRLALPFIQPAALPATQAIQTSAVAPWRAGRLSYNDAPLSELVADVNRYYAPGVHLASSEAGQLRVTASFRTNEIPAFLDALGSALPVEVAQRSDHSFDVSRRAPN